MKTPLLLLAIVSSAPAFAADAARGETLFRERCASCHTASPFAVEKGERKRGVAPDLALRMKQRTGEALKAWVLDPGSRTRESACNTTALAREPELAPDLWAFQQGQLEAPPPPQLERRREALRKTTWRRTEQNKGGK